MSAINDGQFSFNPEELKDWAKVIHALVYTNPELAQIHAIEQGIAYDQQIVFASAIGLLGKKMVSCTPNEIDGIILTDKFWRPVRLDARLGHCSTDVNQQNKLVNQMSRMNPDFYNILEGSQSTIGDFLVASVLAAMVENIFYKVWFGDLQAAHIGESTSGAEGVFTPGTDLGYFNMLDGLWKQTFVADTSLSAKYHVAIAANNGANYAAQVIAPGDAIKVFRALFNKANSILRKHSDAKFLATRSMFDALVDDLENIENTGGGFTYVTENGKEVLRYRGIEVVMLDVWDRFIDEFQNDGTRRNLPNRVMLTIKDNIPIGTLAEEDFGTVEAFYDKTAKKNYIDLAWTLDAKLLTEDLIATAY